MEKKHDEQGYQGWTNYETWTVSLWLDNEEGTYRLWRERTARFRAEAPSMAQVRERVWTTEEAVKYALADELKAEISLGSPLQEPGMYSDLLAAALSEVNWQEIAERWLED